MAVRLEPHPGVRPCDRVVEHGSDGALGVRQVRQDDQRELPPADVRFREQRGDLPRSLLAAAYRGPRGELCLSLLLRVALQPVGQPTCRRDGQLPEQRSPHAVLDQQHAPPPHAEGRQADTGRLLVGDTDRRQPRRHVQAQPGQHPQPLEPRARPLEVGPDRAAPGTACRQPDLIGDVSGELLRADRLTRGVERRQHARQLVVDRPDDVGEVVLHVPYPHAHLDRGGGQRCGHRGAVVDRRGAQVPSYPGRAQVQQVGPHRQLVRLVDAGQVGHPPYLALPVLRSVQSLQVAAGLGQRLGVEHPQRPGLRHHPALRADVRQQRVDPLHQRRRLGSPVQLLLARQRHRWQHQLGGWQCRDGVVGERGALAVRPGVDVLDPGLDRGGVLELHPVGAHRREQRLRHPEAGRVLHRRGELRTDLVELGLQQVEPRALQLLGLVQVAQEGHQDARAVAKQ